MSISSVLYLIYLLSNSDSIDFLDVKFFNFLSNFKRVLKVEDNLDL